MVNATAAAVSTLPQGTYFFKDRFDGKFVLVANGAEVGRVATRKAARTWYVEAIASDN